MSEQGYDYDYHGLWLHPQTYDLPLRLWLPSLDSEIPFTFTTFTSRV